MLDPDTRAVKVVADQFDKNNGVAFTGDGKTAYVYVVSSFVCRVPKPGCP